MMIEENHCAANLGRAGSALGYLEFPTYNFFKREEWSLLYLCQSLWINIIDRTLYLPYVTFDCIIKWIRSECYFDVLPMVKIDSA